MEYTCLDITCQPADIELVFALLSVLPFDAFEEEEAGGKAFIASEHWDEAAREVVEGLQATVSFTFVTRIVPDENWNARWEAEFHPIQIGDFCGIRASFHPPMSGVKHELVIDPKMAFGTGHHETTAMMVEAMEAIDFSGKRVFDFGCGTGVLAILARKLGAPDVLAIDYDPASTENTIENVTLNAVDPVQVLEGSIEVVPRQLFDVILANINRNVLLDTMTDLKNLLRPGGILLLSGILLRDQALLMERATEAGLIFEYAQTKGDWCMLRFKG